MLTVLVSMISDSQVFLLKKKMSSFCSYSHFFSKNISIYAVFTDQSFNDTFSDTVSFEQLGPGSHKIRRLYKVKWQKNFYMYPDPLNIIKSYTVSR